MTKSPETKPDHEATLARAVGLLDRDAIIVANAGAGKTHLLVEHYFALLEAGLEPSQIIAFTFTEKAANELKERIVERLPSHPGFSGLPKDNLKQFRAMILNAPISTIHQFCLKVIEASRGAGDRAAFKIVDEALEGALAEGALRAYLRRRFEAEDPDALFLLQSFGIRDLTKILERYLSLLPLEAEVEWPLPPPEAAEQALLQAVERLGIPLWEEIQGQKQALGWMSFADMERRALNLIQAPPENLRNFLNNIAHVLVDEFQDTAPIQIRLIEALRAQGRREGRRLRLFCVGDPKQSIYRFRDVDRNLLLKTEAEILAGGGEKFDFTVNFRSTPPVLALVNAFTRRAFPEARDSEAQREDQTGSLAHLIEVGLETEAANAEACAEAEAKLAAQAIASWQGEIPLERIAVLYRASASALPLIRELQARGIPYNVRGGQNLFERQEILDLHRLLYFLADPKDDLSLVGVLRSPLFLLSDATLFYLCRREPGIGLWEHLNRPETLDALLRDYPEEHRKAHWALARLRNWLGLAATLSAHALIEQCLRQGELGDLYALGYGEGQRRLAMEQWLDWLKTLEADHAPLKLGTTVRILKEVVALLPNKTPLGDLITAKGSVQLMTVHAAKGLQFDTVVLIGMNRKGQADYPLLQRVGNALALKLLDAENGKRKTERYEQIERHHQAEEFEESKRLLYVAMTRARNRLLIFLNPQKNMKGSLQDLLLRNLEPEADPWKGPLPFGAGMDPPRPAEPTGEDRIPPSPPGLGRPRETTVSELETFLACPLKHYYAYERQTPTSPADLSGALGATEIGTLLHNALNALQANPETEPRALLARLLRAQGMASDEAVLESVHQNLATYLASPAYRGLQESLEDFSELPFLLRVGTGGLRGQIDRLLRRKEGWVLVDFKYTGRGHSAKEWLDAYGFQLRTYALASQRLLREDLHSVQIHDLNRGESHPFQFSRQELETHAALLEQLLQKIHRPQQDLEAVTWRKACPVCPYHRELPICPVPRGLSFRDA